MAASITLMHAVARAKINDLLPFVLLLRCGKKCVFAPAKYCLVLHSHPEDAEILWKLQ